MAVKEQKAEKPEEDEAEKDEAEEKDDVSSEDEGAEETEGRVAKPGPSLGSKIFRAFVFTFLATFLTAFLFADPIPNGLRVDFDLLASLKLALISGVIAAVLRTAAGMLPVFADD